MKKKITGLAVSLALLSTAVPVTTFSAQETLNTPKYIMDAEALPDGNIAVLFTEGGTYSDGKTNDSTLYYGVFDTVNKTWSEETVGDSVAASDAALSLSGDTPHIAYVYEQADESQNVYSYIGYTFKTKDGWEKTTSFESENVRKKGSLNCPDIEVDSSGTVYITCMDTEGDNTEYSSYNFPDPYLITISSGIPSKDILIGCNGDYFGSEGGYNTKAQTPKISLNENVPVIGAAHQYNDKGWGSGWEHSNYIGLRSLNDTDFKNVSTGSGNNMASIIDICGTSALINAGGKYKIIQYGTDKASETIQFDDLSAIAGDLTMDEKGVLFSAFIQNTDLALAVDASVSHTAISTPVSRYNRIRTVVSNGIQYALYTADDNNLVIAEIDNGSLKENIIEDKTTPVFNQAGASLSDSLNLIFDISAFKGSNPVDIEGMPVSAKFTGTKTYEGVIEKKDSAYIFSVPVSPKDYKNKITVTFMDESVTYSADDYFTAVLNRDDSSEALKNLVIKTKEYCEAAAWYFGIEKTVKPENVEWKYEDDSLNGEGTRYSVLNDDPKYYGYSLLLSNRTTVRLYYGESISEHIDFTGFSPIQYNVSKPAFEGKDDIMSPTVNNYIYSVLNDSRSSDILKNLCRALYNYSKAAEAYVKSES